MVNPITDLILTQQIAYNATGLPEYIGKAAPGSATSAAVWQIQKLTYSGNNVTAIEWASGGAFNQIWDNHASLSYA